MDLLYSSTRNSEKKFTASQAILKGLADDGGLFVPESIPALDVSIEELSKMSYQETAYAVMKKFLTDFTEEELKNCIDRAYDSKFDTPQIAPLVNADGAYYLELFHGSTIAFKDMALSILPHLLTTAAKKNNVKNDIVILMFDIPCDRAHNGEECIHLLSEVPEGTYDLVLMDVQMPVMNGREATRMLRQSERADIREIPIVAMTADAFAEDVQACLDAGMNAHIAKPVDIKKVLEVLRQIKKKSEENF